MISEMWSKNVEEKLTNTMRDVYEFITHPTDTVSTLSTITDTDIRTVQTTTVSYRQTDRQTDSTCQYRVAQKKCPEFSHGVMQQSR